MVTATHNPSNLLMSTVEIKVPHPHFHVKKFTDGAWGWAKASVVCDKQHKELKRPSMVDQCRLYVD